MEVLRTPDDRFERLPDFPFEPRVVTLPDGLRMHYVDEGPPDAEPVLLLHGQPTWSYLYRRVITQLTAHGRRAIAPDLMGFGRSDKPSSRAAHTVDAHVRWLAQLVDALGLSNITLVVQDWGGPFGLGVLAEQPQLFRAVVATNTVLHTADASLAGKLTWACHATQEGTVEVEPSLLDYQRLTQELTPFRPSLFVQGATASVLPEPVLAAYDAPFPDESFCAGPRQLPLLMGLTPGSACARRNTRTLEALRRFDRPFVTAFSDGDPATRGWEGVLRSEIPGASGQDHVTLAEAGHFVQEDRGPELADVVLHLLEAPGPTRHRVRL